MSAFSRKKVFIVDDEPEMQIFLSNLLQSKEFEPVVKKIGAGDIQQVLTERPDLIIINLGRFHDRLTHLYRELKRSRILKCIPVIMLSSLDRKTFFHCQGLKSFPTGSALPEPEAFMLKPPEADELLRLVRALTGPSHSNAAGEAG